jgi:hypothetical protein
MELTCRKRTEPLTAQKFGWIMPLLKSPDPYIIDHSGLVLHCKDKLTLGWILFPPLSSYDDDHFRRRLLSDLANSVPRQR